MNNEKVIGFLNIYKPVGMTSHDVVAVLRKITKIKQIGHTGTLDPFAEGVLPVCIGKATRLIEYLEDDKAYIGRFNFGKSTTTYDIEGEVVNSYDVKVTQEEVQAVLLQFQGEIQQTPPIYSAVKVNGKKLYEYAREGKNIEIKPRKVFIEKIELLSYDYEEQTAEIYIKCSKGTYIRSIANDLGRILNNGAYLSRLERVQAGRFKVENSVKLEDIKSPENVQDNLLNPIYYLPQKKQELNDIEYSRVKNGMPIYNRIKAQAGIIILTMDNKIIAISEVFEDGLKIKKVLMTD